MKKTGRNDILNDVLSIKSNHIVLELPTGTGKTKIALDKTKALKCKNILIVVNRNVHKETWSKEIDRWWNDCKAKITFTTYVSLHKYVGKYDMCILDEGHHISEKCARILPLIDNKYTIILSATIDRKVRERLDGIFGNSLYYYSVSLRSAIDADILPDPNIYLVPLYLRTIGDDELIIKNNKVNKVIECKYKNRWNYLRRRDIQIRIKCAQSEYYEDLDNQINYWKNRYFNTRSEIAKNKWLRLCSDRLKWLSDKKTPFVQDILSGLNKCRVLTFCNNIQQTEDLGEHCINSKNSDAIEVLRGFNAGKINHITACNMLNEGINLNNCQIGIYANLNSSETIIIQRTGRLLRHKNPIIIIPYYKNTRDEELVNKMVENYNEDLIVKLNNIQELKEVLHKIK